ncbi:uncharacterized protein LOC116346888 [Contarinia nasturtii]|uniref:uncharacterized protein LOC116346888 n=1 Tax=Contarinia nasturtii TaxID=265458 RepID=UPI0012D445AF|nr:uncharacterized protein LOC116346888 [Contarinia nasturtii]
MAKILSYFHLCPINDEEEFLGLSRDQTKGNVINTLGKNIIINVKLSNQKQITSWTALDKLSSKVVYDFNSKAYVGVFGRKWIRCWSADCSDINKIRKLKLSKPASSLISIENAETIVLYADGTCESLEYAIETRKEKKDLSLPQFKPIVDQSSVDILSSTYFKGANDTFVLTYFVKSRETQEIDLIYYKLEKETLRVDGPINRLKLLRDEKNIRLCGFTVVDSSNCPNLVTIWSDRRIFMMALRPNLSEEAPGHFVSMLMAINVDHPLCVLGVSRDCIAIYGANATQEGGALLLYNTQFKVIESKQLFKVFFTNSRLWTVDTHIFLAAGQKLAVISFRISKEQLSDMLGSQRSMNLTSFVDTECINTDAELEEVLEYDKNTVTQSIGEETNGHIDYDMSEIDDVHMEKRQRAFERPDDLLTDLRSLQQNDILIDIKMDDDLLADMAELKLSANTNDTHFDSKTIHSMVTELERIGESEIAISNMIIPMCIESNLSDDLIICIRNYSNISEKMLAISIKYFLDKIRNKTITSETQKTDEYKTQLNAILSCSFESELMVEQLRAYVNFEGVRILLNHIFQAIQSEDRQLENRPQNGDTVDEDILLVKWFTVIVDSHFHQFILSRDKSLIEQLTKWKEIVDNFLIDIQQSKIISAMLYNLVDSKLMAKENVATKWYSIEEVKLY